jgi:outer membrane protein
MPFMKPKLLILCGLLLSLLLGGDKAKAQDTLTLEEAVRITLENNYDIKLVSNNLQIDRNNVSLGNAGMLPALGANFNNSNSIQDSRQLRSNGEVTERSGARNSSVNYGVGINWTVFDGFGMFARYEQLQELQKLGEANLNAAILSSIINVYNTYYDLVQQQQQLKAIEKSLEISRFRLETAQNRFEIGKAARLEVLNAQVDLNADTTNLLRQQNLYNTTQIQLNELLARDLNIKFAVANIVLIDDKLVLDQLSAQALQQNPSLKAAVYNRRIAELNLRQVKANRYPSVALNTGYNFNKSQSALGFALESRGKGLVYGVTASWNLFNGFEQRRNERNASIVIDNAQLEYEKLDQNVKAQLSAAYQTYFTSLALVQLEEKNLAIAQQNLDITLEKFNLGSISSVEFRDAQLNYVSANIRFANAQYEAKLAEISLRGIAGALNLQN